MGASKRQTTPDPAPKPRPAVPADERRGDLLPTTAGYIYIDRDPRCPSEAGSPDADASRTVAGCWVVMAASTQILLDAADSAGTPITGLRRRLVTRLWPGPAAFLIPSCPRVLAALGLRPVEGQAPPPLVVDDTPALQAWFALESSKAAWAWWCADERGGVCTDRRVALDAAMRAGLRVREPGPDEITRSTLAPSPTMLNRPPTLIELRGQGQHESPVPPAEAGTVYRVLGEGAYEERFIRKMSELTILFVCTGNTCRSPMAEAIARHELAISPLGESVAGGSGTGQVRLVSAGVAAGAGTGDMNPQARKALEGMGIAPGRHTVRSLTRRLIGEADIIYAMSPSHVQAVLELEPDARDKVDTLDPSGADIPDPIGGSGEVYARTAARLVQLVRHRIKELET